MTNILRMGFLFTFEGLQITLHARLLDEFLFFLFLESYILMSDLNFNTRSNRNGANIFFHSLGNPKS